MDTNIQFKNDYIERTNNYPINVEKCNIKVKHVKDARAPNMSVKVLIIRKILK